VRRVVLALTVAVTLIGVSAMPAAAGDSKVKIVASRNPDGRFRHDLRVNVAKGEAKNVYLKMKSKTDGPEIAAISQTFTPLGYSIKYFFNGFDVTGEVQTDNGKGILAKPKAQMMRTRIKRIDGPKDCYSITFYDDEDQPDGVLIALNTKPADCVQ
jgi:hypothetical protein